MIRCNLAVILAERNLKITKVALDTGISRTTLTSLANNRSQGIQLETMNTLCLYLKITPDRLFSFCPLDINVISVEKKFVQNDISVYLISIAVFEHKQYFKDILFGELKKISSDEDSYILDITAFTMHKFDFEPISSKIDLENYFKRIPKVFINDLENNIIDKIFPESDKDSFVIEWDLSGLPF